MMVEAAFSASRAPGPLRAFYRRTKHRREFQVAIVATARKIAVLRWHLITKEQDYGFARASLAAHKGCRQPGLAAGATSRRGPVAGPSRDYHIKQLRDAEKVLVEQEERAYEVLVAHWQPQKPSDDFIRGVHDFSELGRELQEGHEFGPGVLPDSPRVE